MTTQPKSLSYEQREALYRDLRPRLHNPLEAYRRDEVEKDLSLYYPMFTLELTVGVEVTTNTVQFFFQLYHDDPVRNWNRFHMEDNFKAAIRRLYDRHKLGKLPQDHRVLYRLIELLQHESNGLNDTEYIFTRLRKAVFTRLLPHELEDYRLLLS